MERGQTPESALLFYLTHVLPVSPAVILLNCAGEGGKVCDATVDVTSVKELSGVFLLKLTDVLI